MGIARNTSDWADVLWADHVAVSHTAQRLHHDGSQRTTPEAFAGFAEDVHGMLYSPRELEAREDAPRWALNLQEKAEELEEWQRLRDQCSRDGFASGVATEAVLSSLIDHMNPSEWNDDKDDNDKSDDEGQDGEGQAATDAEMRRNLRRASRAATEAVADAENKMDGLRGAGCGTGSGSQRNGADLAKAREAQQVLANSRKMRDICELAGRLSRIAENKTRSEVKGAVGEIHGIEKGDEISRLLGSELANLRHPALRRMELARIAEKEALQLGMKGKEPQGRGPIVVCLDESGSMGAMKEIWSKAVALSLLTTATDQKRAWHLIRFDAYIQGVHEFGPGEATVADIAAVLEQQSGGGTDFSLPIQRACEAIEGSATMRKADVVMITDGEAHLGSRVAERAQKLTKTEGVSWYVVSIGSSQARTSLGAIGTEFVQVSNVRRGANSAVAGVIALNE